MAVAVNTTFRAETIGDVLALGSKLRNNSIDQWALCPLMVRNGDEMHSGVSTQAIEPLIEQLGALSDVADRVVVETDPQTMRRLVGEATWHTMDLNVWRLEALLPNGVWLFARTPLPGYFLRVRYDGALLSRQDFNRIGLREGRYGFFRSGRDVEDALSRMDQERDDAERQPWDFAPLFSSYQAGVAA